MDALVRSQILKEAHDAGWHNVIANDSETVILSSIQRPGRVIIKFHPDHLAVNFSNAKLYATIKQNLIGWPLDYQDFFIVPYTNTNLHPSLPMLADVLRGESVRFATRVATTTAHKPEAAGVVDNGLFDEYLGKTDDERLTKARIGQNLFREKLLAYWDNACAVTGLETNELLKASHSKPWALCESDQERLDPFNGFLLCAHLDSLYDAGLITFSTHGELIVSDNLATSVRSYFALDSGLKLRRLTSQHLPYLKFHHETIFQGDIC